MLKNNLKKYFPWFKNNNNWIYLDSAATSLKPIAVIKKIEEYYTKYSTNPHNNDSSIASKVNQDIKKVRSNISNFFNVEQNEIVFTSGATDGLNLIQSNVIKWLKQDDEVVVSYGEHSSNLLPWLNARNNKKIKLVFAKDKNNKPSETAFINAITKKTKVISFSNASNLFDYQIDVKNIVKHARKINKNIIVIVDATQSVPHTKFDARNNDVDFFVCSAHKMCGPSGIGIMYGKYKHLIKMEPNTYGGGMVSTVENNGKINLAPPPERFEAGTPNTEAILGFGAAIDFLKKIGMNNINNHEIELKKYIDQQFKHIKNIEYVTKDNIYPIVSFNIKGVNPQDLANYLGTNKIIVRGGMACVKMQGMFSNNPNGYVRASFYLYNDKKDVDRLVTVLKNFDQKKQFKNIL